MDTTQQFKWKVIIPGVFWMNHGGSPIGKRSIKKKVRADKKVKGRRPLRTAVSRIPKKSIFHTVPSKWGTAPPVVVRIA